MSPTFAFALMIGISAAHRPTGETSRSFHADRPTHGIAPRTLNHRNVPSRCFGQARFTLDAPRYFKERVQLGNRAIPPHSHRGTHPHRATFPALARLHGIAGRNEYAWQGELAKIRVASLNCEPCKVRTSCNTRSSPSALARDTADGRCRTHGIAAELMPALRPAERACEQLNAQGFHCWALLRGENVGKQRSVSVNPVLGHLRVLRVQPDQDRGAVEAVGHSGRLFPRRRTGRGSCHRWRSLREDAPARELGREGGEVRSLGNSAWESPRRRERCAGRCSLRPHA